MGEEISRIISAHGLLGFFFCPRIARIDTNSCNGYMATGAVALIYTNAMGDMTTTGTTWDNLKLSFAGAIEMTRNIFAHELLGNIFFAHELHELTRIVAMD